MLKGKVMRLDYQFDHAFTFSYRENLDFRLHAQGELEIAIICSGSCRVNVDGNDYVLREGDVLAVFPDQLHEYVDSQNLRAYLMIIPLKAYLSAYYGTLTKMLPQNPVLQSGMWDAEGVLPIVEQAFRGRIHSSPPVMQGYLMVIVGKLLESFSLIPRSSVSTGALQRILQYINGHYREPITRSTVAHAIGYHDSYISHLFSRTMHVSLPEYINALRTDEACRFLRETEMSVTEICSELGFQSIRNFNRVFQNRKGMTPREYRSISRKQTALPE